MNLREVYELMGPLVLRGESPSATAKKLFPNSTDPSGARGLEAYAWNAFATRKEMLESVFPRTRDAIVRTCGERAWLDLGPSFSRAHPATHAKLLRTAEPFPCFLAGRRQIPRWVVELADLELVGRQTYHHPLDDDDSAPLRLSVTLVLRGYGHDFATWLHGSERELPRGRPAAKQVVLAFWRDDRGQSRRAGLGNHQLTLLREIRAGRTPPSTCSEWLGTLLTWGLVRGRHHGELAAARVDEGRMA